MTACPVSGVPERTPQAVEVAQHPHLKSERPFVFARVNVDGRGVVTVLPDRAACPDDATACLPVALRPLPWCRAMRGQASDDVATMTGQTLPRDGAAYFRAELNSLFPGELNSRLFPGS